MILPRSQHLWTMVRYVGRTLLILLVYDLIVVSAYELGHLKWVALQHVPLALYGSAIGVILGFRNNSAYARWWEARTLWGAIVNNSRSLGRQVMTCLHTSDERHASELKAMQRRLIYHQIAYVHALRQELRRLDPWKELTSLLNETEILDLRDAKNVPLAIQQQMSIMLCEALERGWLDPMQWRAIDQSLDDLADAQGGTERIKNTPMPKQYDYFPKLFVHLYCIVLPLAMVMTLGWLTPLGSTLVGFIFLAFDQIGRDLEEPFENRIYDVPMTTISKTIETNLRQLLGETNLPAAEMPAHGVLW
ncbi:MAG TPA: bestrophin family ion channel [Edaphobacter sp.]|nr:bestrophin family ion channel [Edaphobacter sp.]